MSRARDTADQINRVNSSAADATAITVDSSENVGIGTSSPNYKLEVYKSSVGNVASFNSSSGNRSLDITSADNGAYLGAEWDRNINSAGGIHTWSVNDTERMRIDSSGQLLHGISSTPTGVSLGRQLISSSSTGSEIIAFREDSSVAVGDKCGALLIGNSDPDGAEDHFVGMWGKASSTNGSQDLHFAAGRSGYEGDVPQMTLHNSGNVGIGNTSSGYIFTAGETRLSVGDGAEHAGIQVLSGTNKWGGLEFADDTTNANAQGLIAYYHPDNYMQFKTNGSERMRIDSSGNVLVGKTSDAFGTAGTVMRSSGVTNHTVAGTCLNLNRTGSDGAILELYRGGTTIGMIGVDASNYPTIDAQATNTIGLQFGAYVQPRKNKAAQDNFVDIGSGSFRFDDIYATNGTIQTSDFNEKQDIASLTATEMLVGKRISTLFKTFRWKDSVAEKGDNARTHTGVIAQDVQAAFTAEGLDAGDYALFISSTWWETQTDVPAVEAVAEVLDEDGNVTTEAVEAKDAYTRTDTYETEAEAPEGATSKTRMGIRYPELLSFVAAYNEQRFASIEARLTALEA